MSDTFKVKIPPLATTFSEVVVLYSEQQEGSQATKRLAALVERDAATSAALLRIVNSAYFGLNREISQIDRAVTLLGPRAVCEVVMSMGLRETFAQLENQEVRDIYAYVMRVSQASALYAKDLAACVQYPMPETAFTGGLLHQIGRLVLLFNAPVAYPDLWYDPLLPARTIRPPLRADEIKRFDRDHIEIGLQVALDWRLPKAITVALDYQRDPQHVRGNANETLGLIVASAHHAATALYRHQEGRGSSFFGLSAPLSELASRRSLATRTLLELLAGRREAVRAYADSAFAAAA